MGGSNQPKTVIIRNWASTVNTLAWIHAILCSILLWGSYYEELCEFYLIIAKMLHFLYALVLVTGALKRSVPVLFFAIVWGIIVLVVDIVYAVWAVIAWIDCGANAVCTNTYIPFLISNIIVFVLIVLEAFIIWRVAALRGILNDLYGAKCGGPRYEYFCEFRVVRPLIPDRRGGGGGGGGGFSGREEFDDEFARAQIQSNISRRAVDLEF